MKTCLVNDGSKIDRNLTDVWREWDGYTPMHTNWIKFLETLPGVESAKYDQNAQITFIMFNDESEFSMFLLRWS